MRKPILKGNKVTKKIVREYLRFKLETNQTWAFRALTRIYDYQTESEKSIETTNCNNDVGFTGVDAEILTSLAKQYQKKGYLSPKQTAIVMKKMKKYWKQLMAISDKTKLWEAMIKDGTITEAQAFYTNIMM